MSNVFDIVCTGKGTHKRTRITKIDFDEDGGGKWRGGGAFRASTGVTTSLGWPSPRFPYTCVAACSRCPRNLELTPEKFRSLVMGLRERGIARLDISDLPW